MSTDLLFSKKLKSLVGEHLEVSINDNKSTMLSVQWNRYKTKASIHRIFLTAPQKVKQDLVCYLKEKKGKMPLSIKAYIQESLATLDYSHKVDEASLVTRGDVYNLDAIYKKLNKYYFDNKLNLRITWYATSVPKGRSRCSLGLYYDSMRLIKIHRVLDSIYVPEYVVAFIVYHEMTHAASPAYVDSRGINRIHSREFKEVERQYAYYEEAEAWLKENKQCFFQPKRIRRWPAIVNGQTSNTKKSAPMQKKAKRSPVFQKKLSTQ